MVGHIRIRTTNYQCHTVSVYLHIAAPLFRLSRIGIDFSRAIRLAIRPTARLFGFAHVFDVYTSYCARAAAKIKFEVCSCILEVVTNYNPEVGRSRSGRAVMIRAYVTLYYKYVNSGSGPGRADFLPFRKLE